MLMNVSEVERQLMFGVHSEWNIRELRVWPLQHGRTFVSWVFKDDAPIFNGRQRHASIPAKFTLPANVDWPRFKANLWHWLERVKAYGK
jgi:hypothetical protein